MLYVYMTISVGVVLGVLVFYLLRGLARSQQMVQHARQQRYEAHTQAVSVLEQALAQEEIQTADYERELQRLNYQLVEEMKALESTAGTPTRTPAKSGWVLLVIIPLLAGGLYYFLGQKVPDPARTLHETGDVGQFLGQIEALELKAQQNPQNLEQQLMLARSYRVMGRYAESIIAYGKSWELIQNNPSELALFAEALALEHGTFEGKPDELLAQAQAIDATNLDVLMLMGQSALQKGHYQQALESLIPLKAILDEEGDETEWLQLQIEAAQAQLAQP